MPKKLWKRLRPRRGAVERQAEEGGPRDIVDAVGAAGNRHQLISTMRMISPKPSVTIAR